MARNKVKLAWIDNNRARKASLKKRKLGLLKKVSELSTLCGIKACLIIYSPDESKPLVWPSHAEVEWQFEQFCERPELERLKNMTNQEIFLKERATKAEEQLMKFQMRNKEVEAGDLMHQINQGKKPNELSLDELQGMFWLVEKKMKEILIRIGFLHQVPFVSSAGHPHRDLSFPPQGLADDLTARLGNSSGLSGVDHGRTTTESLLSDQWFTNMINNKEHKSEGDLGLPCQPFADITAQDLRLSGNSLDGHSTVAVNIELPLHEKFRCSTAHMGLLMPPSFRPQDGASDIEPSSHDGGSSTYGAFGSDIGLGLHLFKQIGNSSIGSELGLSFRP